MGNKRVDSLDILKLISAFLVVCIHAEFSWDQGYISAVAAVAVPIFFMISGYFYEQTVEEKRTHIQIKKIVKLIILSNAFYFLWHLFIYGISGGAVNYLKSTITIKSVIEFFVFNESPFSIHLWYLGAILYVLLIVGTAVKKKVFKKLYYLIPVLLFCDLMLGKYSMALWGKDIYYLYSRNWLFFGLPHFLLGSLLRKEEGRILKKFNSKKWLLILAATAFAFTTAGARWFLNINGLNATREHYMSTTLLAISLFVLALAAGRSEKSSKLAKLGRNNAAFIYIIHMFIKDVVALLIPTSLTEIYYLIRPIIIFIVSLAVSIVYGKIITSIRGKIIK